MNEIKKLSELEISDKLKLRFERILQQNIKDKNGKELDLEGLSLMNESDPSGRGKYLRWMVDVFKTTPSEVFYEDLYKIRETLELFEKAKGKLKTEYRNVLNYKTPQDLWSKIKKYKNNKDSLLSKNQLKGQTKVEGEYDILFENIEFKVIVPKTHRSSCYWGSGTRWCTASEKNVGTYRDYAEKGPLVIIYYNDKDATKNIQFHIETAQYMDYDDRPIDPEGMFTKYPEVLEAFVDYVEGKEYVYKRQPNLGFYQKSFLNALEKGKSNLARIYLAYGADVDGIDNGCVSGIPICKAVYISNEKEALKTIKMLLKYGAMTNVVDGFINLAHMVASTGSVKILKLMVENEMNINVRDFLGRSPLHSAFMLGKVDMARELIELGLDAYEKDNFGKTPLDLAKDIRDIAMGEK